MTPKVYKAADVCEIAQLQPYVLRSWEKEFPGIGVQKSDDSPRLYRQSDLDQVLRIKKLVFGEGLTLAGARRRIEETTPKTAADADDEVAEVLDALASDARTRIASVRFKIYGKEVECGARVVWVRNTPSKSKGNKIMLGLHFVHMTLADREGIRLYVMEENFSYLKNNMARISD